jgi:hypothetical protein
MTVLYDLLADLSAGTGNRLVLPEYRQIELYSRRKPLHFAAEAATGAPVPAVAGLCRAFLVLEAYLASRTPTDEAKPSWQRYLDLPRASVTDKIVAQLYRILRVARVVAFHPQSVLETREGIVRITGIVDKVVLALELTPAGVLLLESAVAYYLEALRQPYPEAYVEAMLSQYFSDLVSEIKRFSDEGRSLYQFHQKYVFNRHFRFDCDNPRIRLDDEVLEVEIDARRQNPALYPIDFFVIVSDLLHIIPLEAFVEGKLPLAELALWRVRTPDGLSLPASFRSRFFREVIGVNQPMT